MKCYHCGQNEAEHRFVLHIMEKTAEIYLCSGCLANFQQHIALMMGYAEEASPDGYPHALQMRELGSDPFPLDAGEKMKHRRLLIELKPRLREAVEREDYEQAAQLRDEILRKEEGVFIYDT
mgnify:CR=1 FL=1